MSAVAVSPPPISSDVGIFIEYRIPTRGCPRPGLQRTHYGRSLGYLMRSVLDDLGRAAHQVAAAHDPEWRIALTDRASGDLLAWVWLGLTLDQVTYALARIDADGWRPGDRLL